MNPICELINVSKNYDSHSVLNDFSHSIYEGEMVAITGNSGSGKTTLLNIIGLLENPDQGQIKLFGERSPKIGSKASTILRRNRIAYLFQNYALIDEESVDYNLEIPLIYSKQSKKEKQKMKASVLKKVGLEQSLKQKVYRLSGGEQQRLAIARILLKQSDLILADEPTGSLDEENRNMILKVLKELNSAGKTIIIVTHDPYISTACDRVVHLSQFHN